jgi:hypothetical protein
VTTGRLNRPLFSRRSLEARAAASCTGVWKKIAERYWVPTSALAVHCVGLWLFQKTSSSCSYVTWPGSNSTATTSAWPVVSVQTCS